MYKVIYRKEDGRVISFDEFQYINKISYFLIDGDVEFEVPEDQLSEYDSKQIEKRTETVENKKFIYNKELCAEADVSKIPSYGKNQYLVYKNGKLTVQTDINAEIKNLKSKLEATDYIAKKISEATAKALIDGDTTKVAALLEEYKTELEQREAWRQQINELESKQ